MNKKIISLLFLIFFFLIIFFSLNFFKIWTECEFYKLSKTNLILKYGPIILLSIVGLIYSYLLKVKYKFIYYGFIPILATVIIISIYHKKLNKDIQNNKCIITKGVINNITRYKLGGKISVYYYLNNSSKVTEEFSPKHVLYSKLEINDTILVQYTESCSHITKVFTVLPSKLQLRKCKNDCYLINGKLVPIIKNK